MEFIADNHLILWLSFAFCLSLTAGGLLVIFRIGQINRAGAFRYLQYFLVSLYVFGFYSLWSRILMGYFLDVENVERLTTILAQMGVPFFVISLLMQLIWAIKTLSSPTKLIFPATLAVSALTIFFILQSPWPIGDTVRAAYSLAAIVISIAVVGIFSAGRNAILQRQAANRLGALVACSGLLHLTYFSRLVETEYYEPGFVFLFFLVNTAVAVLFTYATATTAAIATANVGQSRSYADFVLNYGITNRETDIIQGIYAGKTNQEIADQLFITIQTVKDHSSRIYQKTQVKNRTQLAALLRDTQAQIHSHKSGKN